MLIMTAITTLIQRVMKVSMIKMLCSREEMGHLRVNYLRVSRRLVTLEAVV